uniref:Uncharacterized protein n=1 Tax=Lepeophtheirus salmonis TaxID=72036 RepID=A0A0K2T956_LEPSM
MNLKYLKRFKDLNHSFCKISRFFIFGDEPGKSLLFTLQLLRLHLFSSGFRTRNTRKSSVVCIDK